MGKKTKLAKRKNIESEAAADVSFQQVACDPIGEEVADDLNEPTMGEKLASLNLVENEPVNKMVAPPMKPPSADSVYILLKQALRADDRSLITECIYRQDQKVITNSLALLDPSDALKLLQSLVSIIHLRGSAVACSLPWLKNLLLQHSTHIISQEASLTALNSLYQVNNQLLSDHQETNSQSKSTQLIESRVSNLNTAVKLSTSLDLLYTGMDDDAAEENDPILPAVYRDESDEDESVDFMDAKEVEKDDDGQENGDISDAGMSD